MVEMNSPHSPRPCLPKNLPVSSNLRTAIN